MNHSYAQPDSKQGKKTYNSSKPVSIRHVDSVKDVIRGKLKIGQPNDRFEQEADQVAEQVMRMSDSLPSSSASEISYINNSILTRGTIHHACASCLQDEELIQPKNTGNVTDKVTPAIHSYIQSLQGGGTRLSKYERSFFEPRMGADLSNVLVHNDNRAARVARSINARAFTFGHNVIFGSGEYSPDSSAGKKLLAHELTHVVQQNGSISPNIQRFTCENNPATAPASGMGGCSTENSRPAHPNEELEFAEASAVIDSAAQASLSTLAARWHADARNDTVRIDSFSSCDGGAILNWKLSCNRANAIEGELNSPGDGTLGIPATATFQKFAHGETEEFSAAIENNRKGLVTLQPTASALPGAVPVAGPTDFRIGRIPNSSQSQVFFAGGSSTLTANAIIQIDNLKTTAPTNVRLIGFTSMEEPGSLAQDRADSVEDRLTVAPNTVTVNSAVGNPAATATRSDFSRARSVEILIGAAVSSTLDCAAVHPIGHPNAGQLLNPPKVPCATMDPATLTAFNAAHPIANDAMTAAMNAINPVHADFNPVLIQRFFGNSDPATLTTLNVNIGNLQTHVSGLSGNLAAPIDGISSITRCAGQCDTGGCESGSVIAYNTGVDTRSTNTLCVPVFKSINRNDQARNLIHESAHGTTPLGGAGAPTEGTKDVAYRHERMMFQLSPADRLRNSDSYAIFALFARERQITGNPIATPTGISVPETDFISGITGVDRDALELAIAQLEKRLSWATDHSNQLFGEAQKVRAGTLAWSATWAGDYMRDAATRFPLTSPPASPSLTDMTTLAAIIERYKIMKFEVNRDLTISDMPSGIISWPAGMGGFASVMLRIGPDFFRASPDNQVSLLLQNLAGSTPDVEVAFIPAYVSFAEFIHNNA